MVLYDYLPDIAKQTAIGCEVSDDAKGCCGYSHFIAETLHLGELFAKRLRKRMHGECFEGRGGLVGHRY